MANVKIKDATNIVVPAIETDPLLEHKSKFSKALMIYATILSIAFVAFHLYTAGVRELTGMEQRLISLSLGLGILFILKPVIKDKGPKIWDLFFSLLSLGTGAYIFINVNEIALRLGRNTGIEILAAAVITLLVLEATRRIIGWPLPIVAIVAIIYGFFGDRIGGLFSHSHITFNRFVAHIGLTTEGIFGSPMAAFASIVCIFIIFAAFLNGTGAGQYFVDLVMGRFGRARGGAAKAAVSGSALMGTLTGSIIANVMGTGTFTIPLMKETGYRPLVAGAVEAVSSTGGMIMPPVMGAAAYIICEMLSVPFKVVLKAALMPAILFYLAVFLFVDLEAKKYGLAGLSLEETKAHKMRAKGKFYFLIPLLVLVSLLIFTTWLPQKTAFYALVIVAVIGFVKKDNRLNLKAVLEIIKSAARNCLEALACCAAAGIIVGVMGITGLGVQLSSILIKLSGGNMIILLVLTMIASLILGMGLTTTASYIILAVLVAPALVKMGVLPIAAHLFVFYFGIYSAITPPVAMGAYAAASISGADPFATGFQAFRIAIPGFLIPFIFIYSPELIGIGGFASIAIAFISACIGVFFISVCVVGYFNKQLHILPRLVLLGTGVSMIVPGLVTDTIGLVLGVIILLVFGGGIGRNKNKPLAEASA